MQLKVVDGAGDRSGRHLSRRSISSAEGAPGGATLWIETNTRQLVNVGATLP